MAARKDERQLDWQVQLRLLEDARSVLIDASDFAHSELDGVEDDLPQRIDALRERIEATIAEFS